MLLGYRFGIAGLLMYGWLRLSGNAAPTWPQWRSAFTVGGLMLCVGTGTVAWAITHIPSGLAALLITTVPLWMVVLDWLWKKGPKPSLIFFGGFALGIAGIIVLVQSTSGLSGYEGNGWAMLAVVVGAACWSAGSLHGRGANLPASPFMSTAIQMAAGGLTLVMAGLIMGESPWMPLEALSSRSVLAWTYLLVFGSFIAFSAFIWLMRNTSPAKVSTYAYVNPVVAIYLGWAFADEPITPQILLASMLLVSAVVIVIRYSPRYHSNGSKKAKRASSARHGMRLRFRQPIQDRQK